MDVRGERDTPPGFTTLDSRLDFSAHVRKGETMTPLGNADWRLGSGQAKHVLVASDKRIIAVVKNDGPSPVDAVVEPNRTVKLYPGNTAVFESISITLMVEDNEDVAAAGSARFFGRD